MNQQVKEVNVTDAYEMINRGAILVDIREWEEIEIIAFDIENYIMLPQSELSQRFFELPTDKVIIVGCRTGRRSLEVARFLIRHNFNAVYSLGGGIVAWHEIGLPVEWDRCITQSFPQTQT